MSLLSALMQLGTPETMGSQMFDKPVQPRVPGRPNISAAPTGAAVAPGPAAQPALAPTAVDLLLQQQERNRQGSFAAGS